MELAILVGVPASGKTSFVRSRLAATHRHVGKDLLGHGRRGAARQRAAIEAALETGASVVVDNIHARAAERAELIGVARAHGARVVGYYFDAPVREAVERNRGRTGKARVPDAAIYVAARGLQPPAPAEGFDVLYRVRLRPGGGFEVTDWPAGGLGSGGVPPPTPASPPTPPAADSSRPR